MTRALRALRTLRLRLTLAYVGLLALLLAALGAYQYVTLRASLISNRVAALQDDFSAARTLIARAAVTQPALRGRSLCTSRAATRAVATTIAQVSGHTVGVVVYGPALDVQATAPPQSAQPQLDAAVLGRALDGSSSHGQVINQPDGDQLVVGFPIRVSSGVCGVAQLASPMSSIGSVLADDTVFLGAGTGAALLIALALGLVITSRALRPLNRLTATAQQLAAGNLRARSQLSPRDDEVGALTRSFDHMADRIEESFTTQKESEEQVRRFIADASHELRTPVTALKGYIDVLRRGAGRDQAALDSALESMGREADRMRTLVLDLLTLARIDAHRAPELAELDLNTELQRLLDEGVPGMPSQLDLELAPSPLTVRADRTALETMVRNVLSNACKYAPAAAQIWSTSRDGRFARVDAHDAGPGIPAADLPHVFERFYRGEKMRAREDGGSGLGLPIVYGLAHMQGGDAAVRSTPGQGTTVSLWLPLA